MDQALIHEDVNRMVCEYLQVNGLTQALSAFTSECQSKNIPCPIDSKIAFSQDEAKILLQTFDEGDFDSFLKIWNLFLSHVQLSSNDMKKLEVYIRVHFALWPTAHGESDHVQATAMQKLRVFFEEESELSQDSSILPLFALPYVVDPKNHPVFKDLFDPNWTQRLREQLESTISKYFTIVHENIVQYSKLANLIASQPDISQGQGEGENIDEYQDRFFQLANSYKQVRTLLRSNRENYGKLLNVTNELINGLEKSVIGEEVQLDEMLKKCNVIFPELFVGFQTNGNGTTEHFKQLASGMSFDSFLDSDVSLFFPGISDLSPECLDFDKIKSVLADGGNNEKLGLMQALRWLLTKSSDACRSSTINTFVKNDILGVGDAEYRDRLFSCMFTENPTYIKECLSRLLNAMASVKFGRNYLASTPCILDNLVSSLSTFKDQSESFICQMVVATLQKLSLRKQMRLRMIEKNVIEWLQRRISFELQKPSADDNGYLMEYGWALLMNLCLHEESRNPTSALAQDLLTCVVQMLLAKPGPEVTPYVVSTLYSLLRNPEIFATAKQMNLQESLTLIVADVDIDRSGRSSDSHLKQVISLLSVQGQDRVHTSGEVDYDDDDSNDPDEFEAEIEVRETWADPTDGTPFGDELLVRGYLRSIYRPTTVKPSVELEEKVVAVDKNLGVLVRPTTPSKQNKKRRSKTRLAASMNGPATPTATTSETELSGGKKIKAATIRRKTTISSSSHQDAGATGHAQAHERTIETRTSASKTGIPTPKYTVGLNLNFPGARARPGPTPGLGRIIDPWPEAFQNQTKNSLTIPKDSAYITNKKVVKKTSTIGKKKSRAGAGKERGSDIYTELALQSVADMFPGEKERKYYCGLLATMANMEPLSGAGETGSR